MSNASNPGGSNPYLIDQDYTTNEANNFLQSSLNTFVQTTYKKETTDQYQGSFIINSIRTMFDGGIFKTIADTFKIQDFINIRSKDSFLNFLMRNGSLYVLLFIVLIIVTYSTNISKLIMIPLLIICLSFIKIQINDGTAIFVLFSGIVLYAYASINNEPDMSLLRFPFPSLKNIGDFLLSDTKLYMAIILALLFWKNFRSNYQDLSFIYYLLFVQTLVFIFLRISSFLLLRTSAFNPSVDLVKAESEDVFNSDQTILSLYYLGPFIFMILGIVASIFGMFIWNPGYKYSNDGKKETTSDSTGNFIRFFHSIGFFAVFLYYFKSHILLMNKLYNPLNIVKKQMGKDGFYTFLNGINNLMNMFIKDITFKNVVQIFRFTLVFFIISSSFMDKNDPSSKSIHDSGIFMFSVAFILFMFKTQLLKSSKTTSLLSSNNVLLSTLIIVFTISCGIIIQETSYLQNLSVDRIGDLNHQNGVDMSIMILYVIHAVLVNRYKYFNTKEHYISKLVWTYNTFNDISKDSPLYDSALYRKELIINKLKSLFNDKIDTINIHIDKYNNTIKKKKNIEKEINYIKSIQIIVQKYENELEKNKNELIAMKQRLLSRDSNEDEESNKIKRSIADIQSNITLNQENIQFNKNKLKNYESLDLYSYKYNLAISAVSENAEVIEKTYSELISLYNELGIQKKDNKNKDDQNKDDQIMDDQIKEIRSDISKFNDKFYRIIFMNPSDNPNNKELNPDYYFLSDAIYSFEKGDDFENNDFYNYGFIAYMFLSNVMSVIYNSYVNSIISKLKNFNYAQSNENNEILKDKSSFAMVRTMSVATLFVLMNNDLSNVCIKNPDIYNNSIQKITIKNVLKSIVAGLNIAASGIYYQNITTILYITQDIKENRTITPFRVQLIESYYLMGVYFIFESCINFINLLFINNIVHEKSNYINTTNFSIYNTKKYIGLWSTILFTSSFEILKKIAAGHNFVSILKAKSLDDVQKNPIELFTTSVIVQNVYTSHYSKYINPSNSVDKNNLLDKLMNYYSDENDSIISLRNYMIYLLVNQTNTPIKYNGYISFIDNLINAISIITILYINVLRKPLDEKTKIGAFAFSLN